MSEHNVRLLWKNSTEVFDYDNYNRDHEWYFEGGNVNKASAAPQYLGNNP